MKKLFCLILAAGVLLAATANAATPRGKQEPGRSFWGAVADTVNIIGEKPGEVFYDINTLRQYIFDGDGWLLRNTKYSTSVDTLSAPGNFPAVAVNGYSNAVFGVGDSLYTGTSVTVRPEGYVHGLGWSHIDAENDTTQIATTGVWSRNFPAVGGYDSLRIVFLTEAGLTTARLRSVITLWNPFK